MSIANALVHIIDGMIFMQKILYLYLLLMLKAAAMLPGQRPDAVHVYMCNDGRACSA